MPTSPDYLEQLRAEWCWRGRDVASRRACATLRQRHPDLSLDGHDDLRAVVTSLDRGGGRSVLQRARIVQALLEEAHDPAVRRALLQTLLPGLVNVCRELRFGEGIVADPHDTMAMAVSLLDDLLRDWAGQSRAYAAPDLLSALRSRLRRWLLKEKATLAAMAPLDDETAVPVEPNYLLARLELLREGPHQRLADLTYRCVIGGVPLRELARDDHSSLATLRQELQVFALAHLLG
jgi:hypothetical protein